MNDAIKTQLLALFPSFGDMPADLIAETPIYKGAGVVTCSIWIYRDSMRGEKQARRLFDL